MSPNETTINLKEITQMNFFMRQIVGRLIALPIFLGMLAIELVKLAFQAALYAFEVVYDGIRHRDWYL